MQVFALCGRSSAWYAQGCSFGHVRGRISGRGGPRTGICHSSYLYYFVFTNLHIERMRYVCTCTDAPQRSAKPLLRSNKLTLSLNPQHPQFGEGALSCAAKPHAHPTEKTPARRQRAPASTRAAGGPARPTACSSGLSLVQGDFPTCDALPPIPLTRLSRRPLKTEDVWLSPQMATVAAGAARSSLRSAFRFAGIRRAPGLAAGLSELAGIRAQGFHHRRRR